MKKSELKILAEKLSESLIKSLPEDLKINETKTGKTISRHLKHLLKKLNIQNFKENRKAEKLKKKKTASVKKSASPKNKA